ncbi:MAG: alpha/beta hydrolase [Firmicutes bacterium]|nr:alpha/beta hydrolase [Bacillota bacterium]
MARKLSDNIAKSFVHLMNFNPEQKDSVVWAFKVYEKMGNLLPKTSAFRGKIEKHDAFGVPMEIFRPRKGESKKLIFIIHGGGFIMGLTNIYRNLSHVYSHENKGATVINIDYRTAPEFKYPSAHDDVMSAWDYILSLGYDPKNIVIIGDSAGGNLMLSLLIKLRDENREMPVATVAISPWACLEASSPSIKTNYQKDIAFGNRKGEFDDEKLEQFLNCGLFSYVGDADRSDKYLSVVRGDYHGMPPMLMTVGSDECLLDDTLIVANKIKEAGGEVEVIIGEGMFHIYPLFFRLSATAKEDFKKILNFIRKHLGIEVVN